MGKGGGQTTASTLPPPPTPKIEYDPATTAAEAALASAQKASYASTTESEDEKNKRGELGAVNQDQTAQRPRRRDMANAVQQQASGIASSAVLTG